MVLRFLKYLPGCCGGKVAAVRLIRKLLQKVQAILDDGLDLGCSSGGWEDWSQFRYTLKVEKIEFPYRVSMNYERQRGVKND